jgi:hypothetical protein
MLNRIAFILVLLFSSAFANPTAAPAFSRQCQERICIHFTADDVRLVEESLTVLARAREEIERDLSLASQESLHVIIAPSRQVFRNFIQGHLPQWTQAFAMPATATMIVRSPRWDRPESSYHQSLVHELLHLLLHERLGNREMPRWLEEGMAIFYAEHAEYEKMSALARAHATGSLIPLEEIDRVLEFQQNRAQLAYQQSFSAVRYLLSVYDVEALRSIIAGVAAGQEMDSLFIRATGSTMAGFEEEWRRHLDKTEKWLWLSEVDELIWLGLPILALVVILLVKLRNRRRVLEWERERAGLAETALSEKGEGSCPTSGWEAPHVLPRRLHDAEEEEPPDEPEGSDPAEEENGIKY